MGATSVLIIGESGTGKSRSIKFLNPKETYLINVNGKDLPFREWDTHYEHKPGGNYVCCDDAIEIQNVYLPTLNKRSHIKNIIIDDFQYIMGNEFMKRAHEPKWDKFTQIGQKIHSLILSLKNLRRDLIVYFLSHSTVGDDGVTRCKTIGKVLDNQISIEGMFTIILKTYIDQDRKYWFVTQSDGRNIAKSPEGMFENTLIPNDLNIVSSKIFEYKGIFQNPSEEDKKNEILDLSGFVEDELENKGSSVNYTQHPTEYEQGMDEAIGYALDADKK